MTIVKDFEGVYSAEPTAEFIREFKRLRPLYSGALKTACTRFEILDEEFSVLQGHLTPVF